MLKSSGVIIDATVSGSSLKFSNHCCIPNARFAGRNLDNDWYGIYAVALRHIKRGEEIKVEFNFETSGKEKEEGKTCRCGSSPCRGSMARE